IRENEYSEGEAGHTAVEMAKVKMAAYNTYVKPALEAEARQREAEAKQLQKNAEFQKAYYDAFADQREEEDKASVESAKRLQDLTDETNEMRDRAKAQALGTEYLKRYEVELAREKELKEALAEIDKQTFESAEARQQAIDTAQARADQAAQLELAKQTVAAN